MLVLIFFPFPFYLKVYKIFVACGIIKWNGFQISRNKPEKTPPLILKDKL